MANSFKTQACMIAVCRDAVTTLPIPPVFLYARAICDVRPCPRPHALGLGGGGNGAAMQTEDTGKGPVGASI